MSPMRKISDPKAEYLQMAILCARSEQCRFDLLQRMCKRGLSVEVAEKILRRLEMEGYVDEQRYAGAFARDKVRFAGWGRIKIQAKLIAKRIPGAAVAVALQSVTEEDYEKALSRSVNSLCKDADMSDMKKRQSILRSLMARGFTFDEAMRGMKGYETV